MKYLITSLLCIFAAIQVQANIYIVDTSKSNFGECTGSITINATGEAGPFTFSIVNTTGGQQPANTTYQNVYGEFVIEGLCPGEYSIAHEDEYGCEFTMEGTVEIVECEEIEFVAEPDIGNASGCGRDGSFFWSFWDVNSAASGGEPPYSYLWSNGQVGLPSSMNELSPGIYTVTVTDSEGCEGAKNFEIEGDGVPDVVIETVDSCEGEDNGEIGVAVSNAAQGQWVFDWSTGVSFVDDVFSIIDNLSPGQYTVTITDNGTGCSSIYTEQIREIASTGEFKIENENYTKNLCFGSSDGVISLQAEGGNPPYDYNWSSGQQGNILDGLSGGFYTVTITDDCDRELVRSYAINELNAINLEFELGQNCDTEIDSPTGYYLTANVTGGEPDYSYSWSNGGVYNQIVVDSDGAYSVTIEDSAGCVVSKSYEIVANQAFASDEIGDCGGLSTGGVTINVDNQSGQNVDLLLDGVIIASESGTDVEFEISGLPAGVATFVVVTNSSCEIELDVFIPIVQTIKEFDEYDEPFCRYNEYCADDPNQTVTTFQELPVPDNFCDKCKVCLFCDGEKVDENEGEKKWMRLGKYAMLLRASTLGDGFATSQLNYLYGKGLSDCNNVKVCLSNMRSLGVATFDRGAPATYCGLDDDGCEIVKCEGLFATNFKVCPDDFNLIPDVFTPEGGVPEGFLNCRRITLSVRQLMEYHEDLIAFYPETYVSNSEFTSLYDFIQNIIDTPDLQRFANCAVVTFCEESFEVIYNDMDVACNFIEEDWEYNVCPESAPLLDARDENGNLIPDPANPPYTLSLSVCDLNYTREGEPFYICNSDLEGVDCNPLVIAFLDTDEFDGTWGFTGDDGDIVQRYYLPNDGAVELGKIHRDISDNVLSPKLSFSKDDNSYMHSFTHYGKLIENIKEDYLVYNEDNYDEGESLSLYKTEENTFQLLYENESVYNKLELKSNGSLNIFETTIKKDKIIVSGCTTSNLTIGSNDYAFNGKTLFVAELNKEGELVSFNKVENIFPHFNVLSSKNDNGDFLLFAGRYTNNGLTINDDFVQMEFYSGLFMISYDVKTGVFEVQDDIFTNKGTDILGIDISDSGQNIAIAFDNITSLFTKFDYNFSSTTPKSLIVNFKNGNLVWEEINQSEIFVDSRVAFNFLDDRNLAIGLTYSNDVELFNEPLVNEGLEDVGLLIVNPNKDVIRKETFGATESERISCLLYDPNAKLLYFTGEFTGEAKSRILGKYKFSPLGEASSKQVYISYISINEKLNNLPNIAKKDEINERSILNNGFISNVVINPNPTSDEVSISIDQSKVEGAKVGIYNVSGMLLDQFSFNESVMTYDMKNLKSGVYIFKFNFEGSSISKKVIKL